MQLFREIWFDTKYMFCEIGLMFKHPKRKQSYIDFYYHWRGLWNHIIFHPWYCLKRGIRNLCIWFPVVWGNDVFDHYFLTNMMDKQLAEMETFWKSDLPHTKGQEHIAKRISWTRKLYRLWMDDFYSMKQYHEHKLKYPESVDKFIGSDPCAFDEYGIPTLFRCKQTMSEIEQEEYRVTSLEAHKKDEKVFKLYMKNLARMRNWWD
jgi:hypothetical protein